MTPLAHTTKFTLAVALLPPCFISLWMLAVPGAISPSTYAGYAALLIALAGVTLLTYRNGQTAGTIGQVLHATETARRAPSGTAAISATRAES